MKYTLEIEINKPREEVARLIQDRDTFKEWQPQLLSTELLEGTIGEEGSTYKIVVSMGKTTLEMTETLMINNCPDHYQIKYDADGNINIMDFWFTELSPTTTKMVAQSYFSCKALMMKLMAFFMPGAFKKQTRKYMNDFKAFVESQ
ncbi:MAG: SRPBCC family protein [Paracoccaceae bacterium]|nr:SRPBCC family protein [Paracoccaceae bacterium]MDE2675676.1 SRPBCC family protein [Paracoccaceae bacterium]MXZ49574.1 SRPBCC family protein [Paracoccaceae bacterium]MYF46977.1 SRPBCC family protein [Paracoccaceae bacterium]MYI90430.1 SRPBCC family protein [Paracoccaceae bacterium]